MPASGRGQKLLAIVNSKAGSASSHDLSLQYLKEVCEGRVHVLSDDLKLEDLFTQAEKDDVTRLVLLGGDGTIASLVNALAPDWQRFELAFIPAGTGNDLARSLGLPLDDPMLAAQLACEGTTCSVDLIRMHADGELVYCLNAATGGLGGAVASEVGGDEKSRWGKFAYWLSALAKLDDPPEYELVINCDGTTSTMTALGLWVSNGCYIGGGFKVAPEAVVDDGWMNLTVVPALPLFELVQQGVGFALGGLELADQLIHVRAKKATVTSRPQIPWSIDGEPIQCDALAGEMLPGALRVVSGGTNPAMNSSLLSPSP